MKLEKVRCDFEIVEMPDVEKYTISNSTKNEIIKIYDNDLKDRIIDANFNKKYRELLYLVMDINASDDATASDAELVLMKIDDLKMKLLNKYFKFLSPENLERYLKMLLLLNQKVKIPEVNRGR